MELVATQTAVHMAAPGVQSACVKGETRGNSWPRRDEAGGGSGGGGGTRIQLPLPPAAVHSCIPPNTERECWAMLSATSQQPDRRALCLRALPQGTIFFPRVATDADRRAVYRTAKGLTPGCWLAATIAAVGGRRAGALQAQMLSAELYCASMAV